VIRAILPSQGRRRRMSAPFLCSSARSFPRSSGALPALAGMRTLQGDRRHGSGGRDRLGIAVEGERVTDYAAIAGLGIVSTPGAVIDRKVVNARGLPKLDAIAAWLSACRAPAAQSAARQHMVALRGEPRHWRAARAIPHPRRPSPSCDAMLVSACRSLRCGPDLSQPVSGKTGTCCHARVRSAGTIAISPRRSERRGISRDARLAAP
jgi:hypothetical protein